MKNPLTAIILSLIFAVGSLSIANAHCEIPCGIYDDQIRTKLIAEHITTIEKSMRNIMALEKTTPVNYNQLVRWVTNKEKHADEIQHIVTQYFMTQRIKPKNEQYAKKLSLLHRMLLTAMKCKQTTDLKQPEKLKGLLEKFEALYFGKPQP